MIRIELPRKAKGQELVDIIGDALDSFGYKTGKFGHEWGLRNNMQIEKGEIYVRGLKKPVKNRILRYFVFSRQISAALELNKEYTEVDFGVVSGGGDDYPLNAINITQRPEFEKEFYSFVEDLCTRLS